VSVLQTGAKLSMPRRSTAMRGSICHCASALQAADRSQRLEKDILAALQNGERLRPLASYPKIVLGDFFFRAAMEALRAGASPEKEFELARAFYSRGAQHYPYAPGFRLLCGDCAFDAGKGPLRPRANISRPSGPTS